MKIKYLIPRRFREFFGEGKEYFFKIIGMDSSKKKYYKSYFDTTKSIFIHIPKCAGTSVSVALYGEDPWHHSIKVYENDKRFKLYLKFSVVREPVERFLSTYKYLCDKAESYPDSIYSDANQCLDIEDFFCKYVESIPDEERNYFLRSQMYYLSNSQGVLSVDYILRMHCLDDDFFQLRSHFGYYEKFPKKNLAKIIGAESLISTDLRKRIENAYANDCLLLDEYLR